MLRGTRFLEGKEAKGYREIVNKLRNQLIIFGFEEIIVPTIWLQDTFVKKAGTEVLNQMYEFKDKKNRPICLIPEVTAIIQEQWENGWSRTKKKPYRIFYESRCYRYERPQAGRYREFFQFGVEILGGKEEETTKEIWEVMTCLLNLFDFDYKIYTSVKRGLDYYTKDGFEVRCESLGAQKQILGGGSYEGGIGFAFGIDRLILALGDNQ
jgi:histidyl-tRNA synthetase